MLYSLVTVTSLAFLPYLVLGLSTFVEGPIATLVGGAATSNGLLLPLPVFFSVVVGNLTADMSWYLLGRFSKLEWLSRLSTRLGIDPNRVEQLRSRVQKNAPRLLFLAKLTIGLPIPTLVATGLSRVPVRRWAGWLVLGELLKSAVLVSIGYLFARTLEQAAANLQVILWSITGVLLLAGFLFFKLRRPNRAHVTPRQPPAIRIRRVRIVPGQRRFAMLHSWAYFAPRSIASRADWPRAIR